MTLLQEIGIIFVEYLVLIIILFLHNTLWPTIYECFIMRQPPLCNTSENIPD